MLKLIPEEISILKPLAIFPFRVTILTCAQNWNIT